MINANVVNAVLRHVGTAGGTTVGVLATLGMISPDDSAKAVAQLHQMMDGLTQAVGAASQLAVIMGPAFATIMAVFAGRSATLKSLLTAVVTHGDIKVEGAIVAPPDVAKVVPSDKVVASS